MFQALQRRDGGPEDPGDRRQRVALANQYDTFTRFELVELCASSGACVEIGRESATGTVRSVRAAISTVASRGTISFWPAATRAVVFKSLASARSDCATLSLRATAAASRPS